LFGVAFQANVITNYTDITNCGMIGHADSSKFGTYLHTGFTLELTKEIRH